MRIIESRQVCSRLLGKCKDIETMFDTGATDSAIRKEVLDQVFLGIQMEPTTKKVYLADGTEGPKVFGTVDLQAEVEKGKPPISAHVFVTERLKAEMIIGATEMERNEIDTEMRPKPEPSRVKFKRGRPPDIEFGSLEFLTSSHD